MKRKTLLFLFILTLFIFQILQLTKSQGLPIINESFNLENAGGIAFQSDDTLQIEVLTGVLNSSSASLSLYARTGTFSFTALNDSTIEVSSPDAEGGYDITISGASQTIEITRFVHQATILTGNSVTITWGWRLESWIGNYTMFALGMSGLILMIASPTWGVLQFKKKGLDPDSFERVMYALLLFCVGFGLLVMWLWSS